jgi:pimeloyl-ACP methyl ester carboxylesterase
MNDLLNLLKGVAPTLATAVAGPMGGAAITALASKFGVSDSVDAVAKAIASDPEASAKLAQAEADFAKAELEAVTKRWEADMKSDSYLSKNIRPLTLIAILSAYFLFAMMSAFQINVNETYVKLLGEWGQLIMLAYFGGRTVEKVMEKRK